ncbi:MAG: 50S ribosomal protein L31e [Thermoproteota archaeon]|nr:MAG: 50S ribosomal protein L31e [Candidatus Korarchaeota archaeon]
MSAERVEAFRFRIGRLVRAKYPHKKRAARTVKLIREFVKRRIKLPEDAEIVVHPTLNEFIWSRGAKNPPRTVDVVVKVFKRKEKVRVDEREEEVERLRAVIYLAE